MNLQVIEKATLREDGALDVVEVFKTIQGEGPFAGYPAIFVRLAGCNLQCPSCDTNYTEGRRLLGVDELVEKIDDIAFKTNSPYYRDKSLVVITGGEPFRQSCGPLVDTLIDADYQVQFETNGTLYDETMEGYFDDVILVCSPKTGSLAPKLMDHIDYLKYIVSAGKVDEEDGLPVDSLNSKARPIRPWPEFKGDVFVQPCDSQNEVLNALNTQAAVKSCMEFGYTLCIQLHKIVGLP